MPSRPQQFRPRPQPSRAEQNAAIDAERGSARQRGYTGSWDKAARLFRLHHPLCKGCEAVGLITAAEVVDHVEPHKGDQAKFWDVEMWQAACRWHHDVIKQKLERMFAAGQITITDLWLDSTAAIRLTLAELPTTGVGGGQKSDAPSLGPAL